MDSSPALRRAIDGDRAALEALLREWWPAIRVWARRDAGAQADEAVQEALLRVTRSIGTADPDRPFGPWLRRVVGNAARDLRSKIQRVEEIGEIGVWDGMERAVDLRRGAQRAVAVFSQLAPRQRELISRIDLHGETSADVARDLGLSDGAVRNQLHKARKAVRAVLIEDPELRRLVGGS